MSEEGTGSQGNGEEWGGTDLAVLWGGVLVHGLDGGDERAVCVL